MENSLQEVIGCKSQKDKRKRSDDGICELPDEILEDILSRLPILEAARTSVLSRRWKQTWTYRTAGFDFDRYLNYELNDWRFGYVNKVNEILKAHNGSTIKEFRVEKNLNATHQSHIDTWIDFALRKRVEKLELQLTNFFYDDHKLYSLKLNTNMDVTFLKSFKLNNVNVTSDVIEHILANCASLEELVVVQSPSLTGVRTLVPCPKLNHLDISYCYSFEYLDIYSAPNLKWVSYAGPENSSLSFRNVPNLSDIQLRANYSESLVSRFEQLPVQVENLSFDVDLVSPGLYNLPRLKNVKHLDLLFGVGKSKNLVLPCSSILEACPNLQKLSLKFVPRAWEDDGEEEEELENNSVHKKLKEIYVIYFLGIEREVKVVSYILSTAPFLEKIIFNTSVVFPSALQYSEDLAHQLVPAAEVVYFTNTLN